MLSGGLREPGAYPVPCSGKIPNLDLKVKDDPSGTGQDMKRREILPVCWYTENMSFSTHKMMACPDVVALFPGDLLRQLASVHAALPGDVYLTGGTVRDLILGRKPADIDLTVVRRARQWARMLADLTGGSYVELGRDEDAARVVRNGLNIDFSSFREGASSIDEELTKRDITINSLALAVHGLLQDTGTASRPLVVIDPAGGLGDLERRCIRMTSRQSFVADPLRMLRVFRFGAVLDFDVDPETAELVRRQRDRIGRVSSERVAHELDLIMGTDRAAATFSALSGSGLLWEIVPELEAGVGMDQPASHHLDVFSHCLETLRRMESILHDPGAFFPEDRGVMSEYLRPVRYRVLLKWASLLHDIGKPATYGINKDKGGRITFYNHDLKGAEIFTSLAGRLRWSSRDTAFVARLIAGHMRPFFLANNQRQGDLTLKACLRLVKSMGKDLPGLFLLAMADALAGKGEGSPKDIEREVAGLFKRIVEVEEQHVAPVRSAPPLITGKDLIHELRLEPGPQFRFVLDQVEEARMEGRVRNRTEALALARDLAGQDGAPPVTTDN
jgi:poly(A) polymerase